MPNNIDPNAASGEGIQDSQGASQQADTNVSPVSADIDAIFGSQASDDSLEGGQAPGGDPLVADPGTQQPDLAGMTPDELARMFQSKYDKAQAELQTIKPKVERADSLEGFVNSLYEDEEVRRAFLAEVEPDLVKPKDPYVALEEQLKKEFGEDYVPDDEDAKKPLTTSWKYYKRLDDLYKVAQDTQEILPKTLKELRADRKIKQDELATQNATMKTDILTKMKWQDTDYQRFTQWASALSGADLAKIYNFAQGRRSSAPNVPNLASQSGGTAFMPNEINTELDKFFG